MRTWTRETATSAAQAEHGDLGGGRTPLGEEQPGDHGAAGVAAREAGGERAPAACGGALLHDRAFPLEQGLHRAVDHDRLDGRGRR